MFETRRRSRRLILGAGALLAIALVVDTVVWTMACRRLDDGARDATAGAGWMLSSGSTRWGGWPLAAEVTLPDAVLRTGPEIIPPLTWAAPRATLRLSAWHPTTLTAEASGAQTIGIGGAAPLPLSARSLVATIDLTVRDPVRIAASSVHLSAPDGPVSAASATVVILPDGVSADLTGLVVPGRAGQPITPPIDALRVEARVTPPIEPMPTASESARKWRSNGGAMQLSVMSLRWGPLDATAHATLTLDEMLQPAVAGQVTATGLAAVIDALAQTGTMTRSSATAAGAMLTILSAPSGSGPVTLPLALQGGVVSLARIPLLRLAPLRWD